MKREYLLALSCLLCAYGCSPETEQTECVPECQENQTCVNGVCEPNGTDNVCDPACNPDSQVCDNGVCVPKPCDPACDSDTQVCDNGVCVPKPCDPACDSDTQVCDNGVCVPKPCNPACDSDTQVCDNGVCVPKSCNPACDPDTQVCDNGVCVPKPCDPACDPDSETCQQGTCVSLCDPACDDATQVCVHGTCEPKPCNPACNDKTEVCEAGVCVPKITECTSPMCRDNATRCDDNGYWEACPAGTGCYLGNCIEGWNTECEENTCSADGKRVCINGYWSACSDVETCAVEEGTAACKSQEIECLPKTCSADGLYYCAELEDKAVYEKCGDLCIWDEITETDICVPAICEAGKCVEKDISKVANLWQLCETNADCDAGVCIYAVSTSRKMSLNSRNLKDIDQVLVSDLDSRIPSGHGICSADCTSDASACDKISTDDKKWSCQVMLTGDSSYPPKDEQGYELNLPFHHALDTAAMATAPYTALCRPDTADHKLYRPSFCAACTTSEDCVGGEVCVSGSCLPECESQSECPLGFACSYLSDDEESISVCRPSSGTCHACVDPDGDGQGFGHCEKSGLDCSAMDPKIYYSESLPLVCSHNIDDTNCNGKIDTFEMLGTAEHCRFCNDACMAPAGASHVSYSCELLKDKKLDDREFANFNPNDASTYLTECVISCEEGWADCDGNPSNGCEVQLVTVDANGVVTATSQAKVYAKDMDQDGHGDINAQYHQYCCGDLDECYAMPNSHYNMTDQWGKVTHQDTGTLKDETTGIFETVVLLPSDKLDDCDDTKASVYGGHAEICDGLDNDCDASTLDGQVEHFGDLALGDSCTVTIDGMTETGKVECDVKNQKLYCHNPSSTGADDNNCDGKDDDKDGLVDEDYVPSSCTAETDVSVPDGVINLCSIGVQICNNGKKTCVPLYTARQYDFFGDGIDSNCDGQDYDLENAVFINQFGTNSDSLGNDEHTGNRANPVASLNRALEIACGKLGNRYCYDIFVSWEAGNHDNDVDPWGKSLIRVPSYPQIWESGLQAAPAKLEDLYATCYQAGCANDRLYPGETYAPVEQVRVYGGFNRNSRGVWVNTENKKSSYSTEINDSLNSTNYVLIKSDNNAPLSVRFENIDFTFKHKSEHLNSLSGITMTGVSCGEKGCRHLSFVNSSLSIEGADGADGKTSYENLQDYQDYDNEVWDGYKDGMNAGYFINYGFYSYEGFWFTNQKRFAEMHKDRTANGISYYEDLDYFQTSGSLKYKTCPDGSSPRGGVGGASCGSWVECQLGTYCKKIQGTLMYTCQNPPGENTSGLPGGKGGSAGVEAPYIGFSYDDYNEVYADLDHGEEGYFGQVADKKGASSSYQGRSGGNGAGGAGGYFPVCRKTFKDGDVYISCDTSLAAGGIGQSGGGGGAGRIYHMRNIQDNYNEWYLYAAWGWAAGGGFGGCGGRPGKAGGVGASVIGLQLMPPADGQMMLSLDESFKMQLKPGMGGDGQNGQDGRYGGWHGEGVGLHRELFPYLHFASTPGGNGGGGGGGGGGAAGASGEAIGMMFVCNRNVKFDTGTSVKGDQLTSCGFDVPATVVSGQVKYAELTPVKHGTAGTAGKTGLSLTSFADVPRQFNHHGEHNNVESAGAKGGVGGKAGQGELALSAQTYMMKK